MLKVVCLFSLLCVFLIRHLIKTSSLFLFVAPVESSSREDESSDRQTDYGGSEESNNPLQAATRPQTETVSDLRHTAHTGTLWAEITQLQLLKNASGSEPVWLSSGSTLNMNTSSCRAVISSPTSRGQLSSDMNVYIDDIRWYDDPDGVSLFICSVEFFFINVKFSSSFTSVGAECVQTTWFIIIITLLCNTVTDCYYDQCDGSGSDLDVLDAGLQIQTRSRFFLQLQTERWRTNTLFYIFMFLSF